MKVRVGLPGRPCGRSDAGDYSSLRGVAVSSPDLREPVI